MFWKREERKRELHPRVRTLDDSNLLMWMDSTLMNVGAAFDGWRFKGRSMDEVGECLDVLNDLWEEISKRFVDRTP